MLSDYMSRDQIHDEIFDDYSELVGYIQDCKAKYIKERKEKGVDKYLTFPKSFEIVTERKNNWIISLGKSAGAKSFRGINDIRSIEVVYYEREHDLRFFSISPDERLTVFDTEVFDQYFDMMFFTVNMRLIQIVKRFFEENGCGATMLESQKSVQTITFYKEGIMFGQFENNGKWLVQESFFTRDCMHPEQLKLEIDLLRSIKEKAEADFDKEVVRYAHAMDVVDMLQKNRI